MFGPDPNSFMSLVMPDIPMVVVAVATREAWTRRRIQMAPALIERMFSPQGVSPRFAVEFPVALTVRPSQIRAFSEDSAHMTTAAKMLSSRYGSLFPPTANGLRPQRTQSPKRAITSSPLRGKPQRSSGAWWRAIAVRQCVWPSCVHAARKPSLMATAVSFFATSRSAPAIRFRLKPVSRGPAGAWIACSAAASRRSSAARPKSRPI